MKRLCLLGLVLALGAAVGCGGASSSANPTQGKEVANPKGKGASDKGGASLEKFDSVPPPPVTK